jgi:hypothetical protein
MAITPNQPSRVITGGRSVVSIAGPDGKPTVIGIFDSCSISESISSEDIHILGRFSPDEITLVSYNAVNVQCSGFRVYGFGVKFLGQFPTLNQLLNLGPVTITVADRGTNTGIPMATVIGCLPDTNSNNFQSRATSKINITYKGLSVSDESSVGDGEAGATSINS